MKVFKLVMFWRVIIATLMVIAYTSTLTDLKKYTYCIQGTCSPARICAMPTPTCYPIALIIAYTLFFGYVLFELVAVIIKHSRKSPK